MSLPNILTFLRILMIPVFATAFHYGERYLAAGIFLAAALTDVLDGYLARVTGKESRLGALLDPLADKLLLLTSFGLLVYRGLVPIWALVIVFTKEVVVVGGWMVRNILTRKSGAVPTFAGKISTCAQVAAVASFLGADLFEQVRPMTTYVLWVSMGLTAVSGLDYLYRGLKELEKRTNPA